MNTEQRKHIHAVVDAQLDGKKILYNGIDAGSLCLDDLFDHPERYHIAPETIEIHLCRNKNGKVLAWVDEFPSHTYEHVETFTHTINESTGS